ncbi:MAG: hypothetical protein H6737_16445 [Alphaproteobacteria bacterium]|nr:hypothetical protein [Alphaproteobacteria bacterium]
MIALWLALAEAHVPILYVVGPADDWCGFLNRSAQIGGETLYPGDVVIFRSGAYGRCAFTAEVTDTDTEFTVLQAENPDDPPRFVHDGTDGPVLDITGTHFYVYDLAVEDVPAGQVGIRLANVQSGWVRFARFSNIAGTGLRVEGDATNVWVLDDRIDTVAGGVGIEVGCVGCSQQVHIRDHVVTGAGLGVASGPGVALDVKDVVFAGSGRGLRLQSGDGTAMITGNLFLDHELAVEILGGPALFRNNIVRASTTAIRAADDGSGDFAAIRVLGNTFAGGAVDLGALAGAGFEVADNAGVEGLGTGNVPCVSGCWRDPAANDFYPAEGSPMLGAGQGTTDDALFEDFCEQERKAPKTAGALQFVGPIGWDPLEVGFKSDFQCSIYPPPGEEDTDDPFVETDDVTRRCGCVAGPSGAGLLALLAGFPALRRRR